MFYEQKGQSPLSEKARDFYVILKSNNKIMSFLWFLRIQIRQILTLPLDHSVLSMKKQAYNWS